MSADVCLMSDVNECMDKLVDIANVDFWYKRNTCIKQSWITYYIGCFHLLYLKKACILNNHGWVFYVGIWCSYLWWVFSLLCTSYSYNNVNDRDTNTCTFPSCCNACNTDCIVAIIWPFDHYRNSGNNVQLTLLIKNMAVV